MNRITKILQNKEFSNIIMVASSNILVLLAGVFTSFLIPKFLGLTEYGYYKIFTLYTSYTAIMEIGFFEGIYLKYTGVAEEKMDMSRFRAYFKSYLLLNTLITCFVLLVSQMLLKGNMKIIFLFVCAYAIVSNLINYFQIISQCLLRFGEYAQRNIIKSILLIVIVGVFFVVNENGGALDYIDFLLVYVLIFVVILCWYFFTYRRFIIGDSLTIFSVKKDCVFFVKIGLPLLIANLCSTLILTLDRQFVSMLFSTEMYAIYSFAYSMLALFTTLTSSVSLVVFPSMKKLDVNELTIKYFQYEKYLFLLAGVFLTLYFPLTIIIDLFLPQYVASFEIFKIVLPTLGFSIVISVLLQNYYKALGENKLYFSQTVIVLGISIFLNLLFYIVFKSMEAISYASFLTIIIWYAIAYRKLKRMIGLGKRISIYPITYIIAVGCFWGTVDLKMNVFVGMLVYFIEGIIIVGLTYLIDKRVRDMRNEK